MRNTVLLALLVATGCTQVGIVRQMDVAHDDADPGIDTQPGQDAGQEPAQEAPVSAPEAGQEASAAEVGREAFLPDAGATEATPEAAAMFFCGTNAAGSAIHCIRGAEYCYQPLGIESFPTDAICYPVPTGCNDCTCLLQYQAACTCLNVTMPSDKVELKLSCPS